jgi:hypothetical protein
MIGQEKIDFIKDKLFQLGFCSRHHTMAYDNEKENFNSKRLA